MKIPELLFDTKIIDHCWGDSKPTPVVNILFNILDNYKDDADNFDGASIEAAIEDEDPVAFANSILINLSMVTGGDQKVSIDVMSDILWYLTETWKEKFQKL